jgi:hypothetical protein
VCPWVELDPCSSLAKMTKSVPSGLGSALEAFRRNPTLGSIAALADRLTADTREVKWEFLSYYPILPSAHPSIQ